MKLYIFLLNIHHLFVFGVRVGGCELFWSRLAVDRVSVPSPIAIDILMDTMARDRVHMYLFFV